MIHGVSSPGRSHAAVGQKRLREDRPTKLVQNWLVWLLILSRVCAVVCGSKLESRGPLEPG